jgi:glycosyltransferase involved in cell wall biosynthesis
LPQVRAPDAWLQNSRRMSRCVYIQVRTLTVSAKLLRSTGRKGPDRDLQHRTYGVRKTWASAELDDITTLESCIEAVGHGPTLTAPVVGKEQDLLPREGVQPPKNVYPESWPTGQVFYLASPCASPTSRGSLHPVMPRFARRWRRAAQRFRVRRQRRSLARLIRSNLRPDPDRHGVLFIIPWMVVGGADRVNLDLATHLNKALFSLHFLTTSVSDNPWADRFAEFSENVFHLPQLLYLENYQYFLLSYIGLAHIKTVLISNSLLGYQAAAAIKQHYPHVQVLDLLHGEGGSHERGGFPRLSDPYEAHLDHRIVVTEYLRDLLLREYRVDASRMTVIRNGIDAIKLAPDKVPHGRYRKHLGLRHEDFVLTYLGRLSPEKHPEHVLSIAQLLLQDDPAAPLHVVMAGDGALAPDIRRTLADSPGLAERVHLPGYILDPEHLLVDSDVVILTSEAEGLPLVALEAMSLGVPVLASAVGGLPELITHGRDGYLIEYSALLPQRAAELLRTLIHNPMERRLLSLTARRTILERFSMERMASEYERIFLAGRLPRASLTRFRAGDCCGP